MKGEVQSREINEVPWKRERSAAGRSSPLQHLGDGWRTWPPHGDICRRLGSFVDVHTVDGLGGITSVLQVTMKI